MCFNWKKIGISKNNLVDMINRLDVNQDGNVEIEEILYFLKYYAKTVRRKQKEFSKKLKG